MHLIGLLAQLIDISVSTTHSRATPTTIPLEDRARGCLLGLATGDAVGTTLEFSERATLEPISDMVGGGPFGLQPGQWTDDTSMALCLATSLLERGFDASDQMRRYVWWLKDGYLSSTGTCFDVGDTVHAALSEFERTGEPYSGSSDPFTAGNGSIMRLAPVVLFAFPRADRIDALAADSSRTTHAAPEAVAGCRMLARYLCAALQGMPKSEVLAACSPESWMSDRLKGVATQDYLPKDEGHILGSGYVVESLEAALWSFATTDSFRDAILRAANLGDDADTTAAVCGQVAGAFYGERGIPTAWLGKLHEADFIRKTASGLLAC